MYMFALYFKMIFDKSVLTPASISLDLRCYTVDRCCLGLTELNLIRKFM